MKPTAEQEALWQSVATMAVYGRDAVRTMHLLETDEVPEADDRGRRRVEGFKIAWEGRVLEGGSGVGFDDVYELLGRGGKGLGNDHRGLAGVSDFGSVKTTKLDICQEEQIFQHWTNIVGTLHGAASAWIVDTCTSAAMVAIHTDTFWGPPMMAGMTLSMELQYLHAAPLGTKLKIAVTILKCTETLANLRCEIADLETGKLFVVGNHLKTWKPLKAKL
ncbi:hypothetical protein JCM24511_09881 [Saitozyma sp. JCM 24511]|nr:hypothetical protein JCM24511_09881 [Saitozyma sp. JCM 24511]